MVFSLPGEIINSKNLIHELRFVVCLIHNKLAFYNICKITQSLAAFCFKENIENTNLFIIIMIIIIITIYSTFLQHKLNYKVAPYENNAYFISILCLGH